MFEDTVIRFGRINDFNAADLKGQPAQVFILNEHATEAMPADLMRLDAPGVTGFSIPCRVLHPDGPEGSFKPIDDQAKKIGEFIGKEYRSGVPVYVLCTYGEQRSPAVALGLSLYASEAITDLKGNVMPQMGTFGSRTAGWVAEGFEEALELRRSEAAKDNSEKAEG